jgi:hypothetical protein
MGADLSGNVAGWGQGPDWIKGNLSKWERPMRKRLSGKAPTDRSDGSSKSRCVVRSATGAAPTRTNANASTAPQSGGPPPQRAQMQRSTSACTPCRGSAVAPAPARPRERNAPLGIVEADSESDVPEPDVSSRRSAARAPPPPPPRAAAAAPRAGRTAAAGGGGARLPVRAKWDGPWPLASRARGGGGSCASAAARPWRLRRADCSTRCFAALA